jgi:glycosyltransferase involved in cell wall biosynthesis
MKIDLHVHSKFSKRPSQWILQKIGCSECYTEPLQLYKIAKKRGMTSVTITDHNTISGSIEIAHLPDAFVSEEVTTYFPEDQCKLHVLVYDIDEGKHEDIQKLRRNVFDLVEYLDQEQIRHALAHPLYAVNDRLTVEHFEKLLLLFQNFELNGARDEYQNDLLRFVLSSLEPRDMEALSEKHGIIPRFSNPWIKNLTAGSDDHSSLNIARSYTEVPGAKTIDCFFKGLCDNKSRPHGRSSNPQTLAYTLYSITYKFYKSKFRMERHVDKDILLTLLDRFLQPETDEQRGVISRLHSYWSQMRRPRLNGNSPKTIEDMLRCEAHKLIWDDPKLMEIVRNGHGDSIHNEDRWLRFVNKVSSKVMFHFGSHLLDHFSGGNVFNVFQSIGSAGALYTVLAPYFVAFSVFTKDKQFNQEILQRFRKDKSAESILGAPAKVAHFTDTFYEINGVAQTLQQQVQIAARTNKAYTVITCHEEEQPRKKGIKNFNPIGAYALPEYPEQQLYCPPFLEMLQYCYEEGFTHIHSATPGPIGLAALAIARILKIPISGTYHTALPQYALHLTGDDSIEHIVWKYAIWYYDQMESVYAPSKSTAEELATRGIQPEKIRFFPRGVDTERFHPSKRNGCLDERYNIRERFKLLYVGRISKEKNLPLLCEVFKNLSESRDDVHFVAVGDGPYFEEMQELMKGAPCTFTGYLKGDDLAAVYASSDLFVFPSTTDTFGNVALEAQASGLPVIVTDSGGPQEIIIPSRTGLVVEADNPASLLEAINQLLSNPARMESMGKEARRFAEERSFENAFNETWNMYGDRSSEDPPWDFDQAV